MLSFSRSRERVCPRRIAGGRVRATAVYATFAFNSLAPKEGEETIERGFGRHDREKHF